METVVLVMMIMVCFNYILKQTYRKVSFVALSSVICALFVGLMWQYAIEQSKSRISDWLADTTLMLDISVILTLEVLVQMTFCILSAHIHSSGKVKHYIIQIYRVLRWFPGILIFPVLFSVLVAAVFAFPGVSFPLVAWCLAALVLVVVPLSTWLLKRLLPEKEIRLELLFLSNALMAILSIVATVNGRTAVAGNTEVDWLALGTVLLLVAAGLVCGIVTYKLKLKKIIKNQIIK